MRLWTVVLIVSWLLGALATPQELHASRRGLSGGYNGSPGGLSRNCTQCHAAASTSRRGGVEILGLPDEYQADAEYDLIVRISDPDQEGAGFQLSAETDDGDQAGNWIVIDSDRTQVNSESNWINHTAEGVDISVETWESSGNSAEYSVRWQAPSDNAGPVTFWAAGNAINDDQSNDGDHVYLANETVTYSAAPSARTCGAFSLAFLAMSGAFISLAHWLMSSRISCT